MHLRLLCIYVGKQNQPSMERLSLKRWKNERFFVILTFLLLVCTRSLFDWHTCALYFRTILGKIILTQLEGEIMHAMSDWMQISDKYRVILKETESFWAVAEVTKFCCYALQRSQFDSSKSTFFTLRNFLLVLIPYQFESWINVFIRVLFWK